jgi:hypothetical protein
MACNAAREGCEKAGEDYFKDEDCLLIMGLGEGAKTVARDCFKRECDKMSGCLDSLIDFD